MQAIRPAAVAGTFYPADAATLRAQVQACLDEAQEQGAASGAAPKLLIVPHAGYIYSGPVAGFAYARLAPWAGRVRRVILAGPTHRVAVRGLAVPTVDSFETPLGRVAIDALAREDIAGLPQVVLDDRVHAHEHSLEVQLPFLQAVLGGGFTLLPLAVGDADAEAVAEVIERLWGGDETLIVVSSDLSHYLRYDEARALDRATVERIVDLATDIDPYEACGAHALNGALAAARRHGLEPQLLDLRNSGDTAGDRQRVVGYAALALAPGRKGAGIAADDAIEAGLGSALLRRARNSIASALGLPVEPEPDHPALALPGATFVTLRDVYGELRGCVGRLDAAPKLGEEVRRNAAAAAFKDPRFPPLGADEWPGLCVSVSLLEPSEPLPSARSFADAALLLRPGIDGVILEWRGHRATLLPQVWSQVADPADFLEALLHKAGMRADFWAADVKLRRYRVQHFAPGEAAERTA
jgi:AmmeMemoRadiSam system protein B/AmmeMemoRadiSam system protein A